ncbi:Pfs, NACHT and WD domain protein [Trichoderma ceciliae]
MSDPNNYTVGWISALEIEYAAAQEFLDDEHEGPKWVHQNDENHYTLGRVGKHNVVIAVLPRGENGVAAAAMAAKDMMHTFPNVRVCLMVGIGGGAPSTRHDIRLGDVVVSAPTFHEKSGNYGGVIQYDYGRTIQERRFQGAKYLNRPPRALLTAVTGLSTRYKRRGNDIDATIDKILQKNRRLRKEYGRPDPGSDRLYSSDPVQTSDAGANLALKLIERPERSEEEDNPTIHYGLIASADGFMEDAQIRDMLAEELDVLCFEMEAAGLMNSFPCLIIRGICHYSDRHWFKEWRGYAAMAAAAYARALLHEVVPNQLEAESGIGQLLGQISEDLKYIQYTTTNVREGVQKLHTTILNVDQKIVLDRLPVATGASFDSHAEEHNPTCLPDTRVELLHQISNWAHDPNAKAIFWLSGMAGTGKSTISRTIAQSLASTSHLGASFFFKRGEGNRGSSAKLFTTIATQLAIKNPAIAPYIKNAIDADPIISDKGLKEQFDKLILQPLSTVSLNAGKAKSLIIVIDALDECELEDEVRLIIHLFGRAKSLWLRVFVTSRPELPIRLGFSEIKGEYQDVILHEISEPVIKHDLSVFLKHELGKIRDKYNKTVQEHRQLDKDWPCQSSVDTLVKMAIPLFIFAATVCRFLSDRKCGNPDERLRKVLNYQTKSQEDKLNATYLPVLDQTIAGLAPRDQNEVLQQFRHIVGSIVLLASPLSTSALAQLLNIPRDTIDNRLDMLHSVLSIPLSAKSPVRLLHLSFRDFLVDPEKQGQSPFWIDEAQVHAQIAADCLRTMEEFLRADICNLRSLGLEGSIIDRQKVNAYIPTEVQYACLNWVFHLQGAQNYSRNYKEAFQFLKQHFLHWVEALSLIRRAPESIRLIKNLQAFLQKESNKVLFDFLNESLLILQANLSAISTAPLQIYSSILIFAPHNSIIRRLFKSEIPGWIHLKPMVESNWDQYVQNLEGHSAIVFSIAFSHDSSLIASGSGDQTLRLWRTDTGECIQKLEGHGSWVISIAFSHNSSLIASASKDGTVRLWRADTAGYVQKLKINGLSPYQRPDSASVAFSHDSLLIASAMDDNIIRLWRTDTGEYMQKLEGHSDKAFSIAFSHNSLIIASGSDDQTVRLWCTNTGECIQKLEGHSSRVLSIAFSYNSSLIASASKDGIVRLWRVNTGECVQKLEGHSNWNTAVAFSHNLSLIASASMHSTVRLWRADIDECVQKLEDHGNKVKKLEGHSGRVESVIFSHNSSLIASASDDKIIRLWCANTGECVQKLKGYSDEVKSIAFSHNSSLIASASDNKIWLWRADTGECIRKLEGHKYQVLSIAFSYNSSLIASSSTDQTIRLWRADTGKCMQKLTTHSHSFTSIALTPVAFSHNSSLIVSVSYDHLVQLWHTNTGECIQKLKGHYDTINSVAFSHNSLLIASGSSDHTVRLWRADTGECMQKLKLDGHRRWVTLVAFSHDSSLIASASVDGTVRLWRVNTGECMQTLNIADRSLSHLSFKPDQLQLLTNVGAFATAGTNYDFHATGYGFSRDRCWITWNGNNLLWLPVEYRPSCTAVSKSTIVAGCYSGRVWVIAFSAYT